jgi:hypothetical protein
MLDSPKTRGDVIDYLKKWLEPTNGRGPCITYRDNSWVQTHGFQRAFCIHQVFRNETTGELAFHVDEFSGWDGLAPPNMGVYATSDDMLAGVASKYAVAWKLDSGQ